MATITIYDIALNTVPKDSHPPDFLEQIRKVERRTFPKDEAMDFEMELKKRNTEITIVLGESDEEAKPRVVAYMLYARLHGIALLQKICVLESYQRRGTARKMLSMLKTKLESQGCERLQLWVDMARKPARSLYASLGFRESDRSRDYYAPGRHGIKMVLDLNSVW